MQIEVTSVSKSAQKLSRAPAAITVLTQEDLRRFGPTSLAEALRMVPGLHVAHVDANKWAIGSRGFGERFANKLLVLIDGRSVYTPAFSGVYWEFQDLPLADVERIEVIRGPGGTLWGANAVNGVINVVTKPAGQTQGLLLSAGGGNLERSFATLRYGGRVGDHLAYRAWVRGFDRENFLTPDNRAAHDGWHQGRGGIRLDWSPNERDSLTVIGDFFQGAANQVTWLVGRDEADFRGGDLLARWERQLSPGSSLKIQGYYDAYRRAEGFVSDTRHTVDFELQHDFQWGGAQRLTWGFTYRYTADAMRNTDALRILPAKDTSSLASFFAQDRISLLPERLILTVGSKLSYNEFSSFEVQPSARLLWAPSDRHSVWVAVSRAVRTPARVDKGVQFNMTSGVQAAPGVSFFAVRGSPDVPAETLVAYEAGYRGVLFPSWTADVSAFYFDYNDLRSLELGAPFVAGFEVGPGGIPLPIVGLPLTLSDKAEGHAYGLEVESTWQPLAFWKLVGSVSLYRLDLRLEPGSSDPLTQNDEKNTPTVQFKLRSALDLPHGFELDSALYYASNVESQSDALGRAVRSYWRGDLRLGWRPRPGLELSLVGQNLFHHTHTEFGDFVTVPSAVPRGFYAKVTWRR